MAKKTTVFIVFEDFEYDGTEVMGVFKTEEKAEKYMEVKRNQSRHRKYFKTEFELDKGDFEE